MLNCNAHILNRQHQLGQTEIKSKVVDQKICQSKELIVTRGKKTEWKQA